MGFPRARGNPRGTMTYTGSNTNAFAPFLLGLPPSKVTFVPATRPDMDVTNWEQGYFFQDDWKVKSNLTVNLGIRYELVSPWVDKHDILLNFDPTFNNNTGRFIVPSERDSCLPGSENSRDSTHGHRRTVWARRWPRAGPDRQEQFRSPRRVRLGHWRQIGHTRRLWNLLPDIGCPGNSGSYFDERI